MDVCPWALALFPTNTAYRRGVSFLNMTINACHRFGVPAYCRSLYYYSDS